jgi:TRAP-type C4-dicarboxylate transport system permease small subunit
MKKIAHCMGVLANCLTAVCTVFMVVAMFTMATSVFIQIVLRVFLDTTWLPLDDLVVYGFAVIVFTGTALVFRTNTHLATPVFLDKLSDRPKEVIRWLIDILCLLFLGLMLVEGSRYAIDGLYQFSPLLHVPVGYIYMTVPLAGLSGIVFILHRRLISSAYRQDLPNQEIVP